MRRRPATGHRSPSARWTVDDLVAPQLSLAVDPRTELRPDVVAISPEYVRTSPVPIEGTTLVVDVIAEEREVEDRAAKTAMYRAAGCTYWRVDLLGDEVSVEGVSGVFTDQRAVADLHRHREGAGADPTLIG